MTPDDAPAPPTIDHAGRVVLTDISSHAFEHPADKTALTAMRSLPGFDQVLRATTGMMRERQYRLAYLASSVRVGERQFPDLHEILSGVTEILDVDQRPELFVYNDPVPNAITLGVDKPFIAMSSGLYNMTSEDERRFVIGHETGHVMSGHALYQSLLIHLLNLVGSLGWIPASGLGLRALIASLRGWERKAELSADRAGLLAGQDTDAALRVHMKLAGGANLDKIDADAFLEQAKDYEAAGDLRDGVLKLLNTERSTHPFAVIRAAEVRRWIDSGDYQRILDGHYPRRSQDSQHSFGETAREAGISYKKRIDESTDPLVTAVRNFGATVGTATDNLVDWIGRKARGQSDEDRTGEVTAGTDASDSPEGKDA
ncbi:MAG: M48 family metallopeptidase [Pseudonocardiales bacterium]